MVGLYDAPGSQITQPNPAAGNLETWKMLVATAAEAIALHLFLSDPAKINKYADDPGDPVGSGKGFIKLRHRNRDETGFLKWLVDSAIAPLVEEDSSTPYLGFINVDDPKGLLDAATSLHGGTNQKSAEAVVAAWKSLGTAEIVHLAEALKNDTPGYLPLRHQSAVYPDNGSPSLTSMQFNVASNVLKTWGAYDRRSFTAGQMRTGLAGRKVMDKAGLKELYIALSYSEVHSLDSEWASYRGREWYRDDSDEGEYIDRPLLITEANNSGVAESSGLRLTTWKEIKENPYFASRMDASVPFLDREYKYDNVVFMAVGDEGAKSALETYLKQFVFSIARNFPAEISSRLVAAAKELVEDREQSDNEVAALRVGTNPTNRRTGFVNNLPPAGEKTRSLKPSNLQCFLMENIGMLADYKKNQKNPYKNLMQLKAGSNDPGDTISILNCKGKQKEVGELLKLTPATYAALVPYIKLYRLDYTNADDADPMVPIRQQEIPIPNYMDPEDVSRITSGQLGRTSGWGIQSFSWKLDGMQPGTVDNNISANLKLYFQSVDDLFKGSRNAAGQDQAGRDMAAPLDLLIPSAACRERDKDDDDPSPSNPGPAQSCVDAEEASIAQGRDGACFRIKVVAGWATPPNLEETHPDLKQKVGSETRGEILRRGLQETRITLYLQQTRHNLTFNENGSCALSIDYQAALSGILTDNRLDILGTNDIAIYEQLRPLREAAKAAGKDMDRIYKRLSNSVDEKDLREATNNDEGYQAAKERKKEYVQMQIDFQNQDKLKKYKRFLSRLYGRHEGGASDSPKMYVMEVDPKLLRQGKLADEKDTKKRAKRARRLMTGTHTTRGWAITNPLSYEKGKSGENTNLMDLIGGADTLEEASEAADGVSDQFLNNLGSGQNMYIPFFYLGDLIDTILQNNKTTQFGEGGTADAGVPGGFMTFMADMDITNPLLLYQANEQDELMCTGRSNINSMKLMEQLKAKGYMVSGGVKKRINIGQIPISLDAFNVWFKNKVIKGGMPTYYLLHFLKDICAQLIMDSLKEHCFNTNIINDIRFDLSHVHFNNRETTGNEVRPCYPNGPLHTVPVHRLAELMGANTTRNLDIPPRNISETEKLRYNLTSGLVLFCTDEHPRNRLGRKGIIPDQNLGIYHNYVGSPVGLVKKIGFSRMQQQYLRESKLQKFGNLGAEQLRELYSANLELIGNTLYKNGQHIFLWPSAMTTGDDSRIITLGLGGYFMIKSVSHTIGPSGYNVSLTALQEGMEIGPQPSVEATVIDDNINPDTSPYFNTEDGRQRQSELDRVEEETEAARVLRMNEGGLIIHKKREAPVYRMTLTKKAESANPAPAPSSASPELDEDWLDENKNSSSSPTPTEDDPLW